MKVTKAFELKIDDPCAENFDAMPRTNCGMFCGKCQKEVIDFTNLTDVELIDILKRKPDTCGLYRGDQLNKFYQFEEVIPERKPFRAWMGIMTFIAFLGFGHVDAQVKNKPVQQKTAVKGKNIPKGERIYCKLVDTDGRPIAQVKVTAGIEVVETDSSGLFDISNPFSGTTNVVTLNFNYNGMYMYEQLHPGMVKDATVLFKFNIRQPLINNTTPTFTGEDIKRMGGAIDMTKVVTAGGVGLRTTGGRSPDIYAGGSRNTGTITIIDGIIVNGKVPELEKEKKPNFFQRLFGKKAK